MNPRYGVHRPLEDEADRLIRESLIGVTSQAEKKDILTPWKEKDRRDREVYTESGVPDSSTRSGMYHRAWNSGMPHLNSRDGTAVRGHRTPSSLSTFVEEHGVASFDPHGSD